MPSRMVIFKPTATEDKIMNKTMKERSDLADKKCRSCHGDGEYESSAGSHSIFLECHCVKKERSTRK